MAQLYMGLSGYAYKEWQGEGRFYPPGLKQSGFLEYYVTRYNAVEADGTWYQMPSEASVEKWLVESPPGFQVSPKMHRKVTHLSRLKPDGFEAAGVFVKKLGRLEKAGKLGPILIQLPPNLKRNDEVLSAFLEALPQRESLRWCLEFRNESWHAPEVEEILRSRAVSWGVVDTDEANAQRRDTSDHVYARLRKTDYSDAQLKDWASYFRGQIDQGRDCYVYCKHKDAEAPWKWADRILELT